jgi:hypothetical protein
MKASRAIHAMYSSSKYMVPQENQGVIAVSFSIGQKWNKRGGKYKQILRLWGMVPKVTFIKFDFMALLTQTSRFDYQMIFPFSKSKGITMFLNKMHWYKGKYNLTYKYL